MEKIFWSMIILNRRMMRILKREQGSPRLARKLADLLAEGIMEKDQCFFLRRFYASNPHITPSLFEDKTAYECFLNGIHIEDFCRRDIVSNALLFVSRIEKALQKAGCRYEIILSVKQQSCVFTFHSFHESEVDWIDLSKIEDMDCGIAVFRL